MRIQYGGPTWNASFSVARTFVCIAEIWYKFSSKGAAASSERQSVSPEGGGFECMQHGRLCARVDFAADVNGGSGQNAFRQVVPPPPPPPPYLFLEAMFALHSQALNPTRSCGRCGL